MNKFIRAGFGVLLISGLLWIFSGDDRTEHPDFISESTIIQENYKPAFSKRKIKHLLIYIHGLSIEYNIDYNLVKAIIITESNWNHLALSSKDCKGLMQISQIAAKQLNSSKADLYDPYINITLGVLYLSYLLDRYNGDEQKMLKAYHKGPTHVDNLGFFEFGRDKYVTKVLQLKNT